MDKLNQKDQHKSDSSVSIKPLSETENNPNNNYNVQKKNIKEAEQMKQNTQPDHMERVRQMSIISFQPQMILDASQFTKQGQQSMGKKQ